MESKYALRRDFRREWVILVTGMCLVLAAQQERRKARLRRLCDTLILVSFYAFFAQSVVCFAINTRQERWVLALVCTICMGWFAVLVAELSRAER